MATITQILDLQVGFPNEITDEIYATGLIEKAERKLAVRLGDLTVWANTPERLQAVKDVVSEMVQRVLRSGGSEMKSESDGEYSYTIDPRVSSGSLWITDENWAQLLGPDVANDTGMGTIRLSIPDWSGRAL